MFYTFVAISRISFQKNNFLRYSLNTKQIFYDTRASLVSFSQTNLEINEPGGVGVPMYLKVYRRAGLRPPLSRVKQNLKYIQILKFLLRLKSNFQHRRSICMRNRFGILLTCISSRH